MGVVGGIFYHNLPISNDGSKGLFAAQMKKTYEPFEITWSLDEKLYKILNLDYDMTQKRCKIHILELEDGEIINENSLEDIVIETSKTYTGSLSDKVLICPDDVEKNYKNRNKG